MTNEELNQIRQVSREEIKTETEPIKKDMQTGFQRINQRLDQVISDNVGFFHETWKSIDEIKDSQDKRIGIIEETLGLDESPHKN